MNDILNYTYQNTPVRVMLKDDGIYFVYRDLCRIPGFRAAAEKSARAPVYESVKAPFVSTTVRLISCDDVFAAMDCMPEHYHLYRWLMGDVLPGIYRLPGCERFRPRPPWERVKTGPPKQEAAPATEASEGRDGFCAPRLLPQPLTDILAACLPIVFIGFFDDVSEHKEKLRK